MWMLRPHLSQHPWGHSPRTYMFNQPQKILVQTKTTHRHIWRRTLKNEDQLLCVSISLTVSSMLSQEWALDQRMHWTKLMNSFLFNRSKKKKKKKKQGPRHVGICPPQPTSYKTIHSASLEPLLRLFCPNCQLPRPERKIVSMVPGIIASGMVATICPSFWGCHISKS